MNDFAHDEVIITSSNETGPESYLKLGRVVVPEFEIYSNPTITIADVRKRRFSLIDRYSKV